MRNLLFVIPFWLAVATASPIALAQDKALDALIAAIPAEVPEVISGGSWNDAGAAGSYRAILLMGGRGKEFAARVYLQWIAFKAEGGEPQILKTMPIKEVNDKRWQNGFIAMGDAETDNEMTIIVTSYDPKLDKEVALAFKAGRPGSYAPTEPPRALAPSAGTAPQTASPPPPSGSRN